MIPFETDVSTKRFASIVATKIDSRLIWYKHYYIWDDELIDSMAEPPLWIIDIATIRYAPDAVAAIARFINSEPVEEFENRDDYYIACLLLRYRTGAISWATFLSDAGSFADGALQCRIDCGYFFEMLNELENSLYSIERTDQQAADVMTRLHLEIEVISRVFSVFHGYFQRFIQRQP